jgi:phage terminase Nu1 subunit (DNA packaging protein)
MKAIGLLALCLAGGAALAQEHGTPAASSADASVELRMAMRKLWEDHITYTRNYIISGLAGLPDADAAAGRLMKNQEDIGMAIKPYYGSEAGDKLTSLLKEHIQIAAEIVKAAKANQKEQVAEQQKTWSKNGKDIAAFLSGANPKWKKADLEDMLQKHVDLTTGEVVSRLQKDWKADIDFYDRGHEHMLMFSDALTDGIVQQYPARFKR